MLALITKASDDYWYEFKEVETVADLFKIYNCTIVEENEYSDWDELLLIDCWEEIKKEDIPRFLEAECHITIYDDYVE